MMTIKLMFSLDFILHREGRSSRPSLKRQSDQHGIYGSNCSIDAHYTAEEAKTLCANQAKRSNNNHLQPWSWENNIWIWFFCFRFIFNYRLLIAFTAIAGRLASAKWGTPDPAWERHTSNQYVCASVLLFILMKRESDK